MNNKEAMPRTCHDALPGEHKVEFGNLASDGTYAHVKSPPQSAMLKCPHFIMVAEHYRDDATCRCDDETHTEMSEWGYFWDGQKWDAPEDDK